MLQYSGITMARWVWAKIKFTLCLRPWVGRNTQWLFHAALLMEIIQPTQDKIRVLPMDFKMLMPTLCLMSLLSKEQHLSRSEIHGLLRATKAPGQIRIVDGLQLSWSRQTISWPMMVSSSCHLPNSSNHHTSDPPSLPFGIIGQMSRHTLSCRPSSNCRLLSIFLLLSMSTSSLKPPTQECTRAARRTILSWTCSYTKDPDSRVTRDWLSLVAT